MRVVAVVAALGVDEVNEPPATIMPSGWRRSALTVALGVGL